MCVCRLDVGGRFLRCSRRPVNAKILMKTSKIPLLKPFSPCDQVNVTLDFRAVRVRELTLNPFPEWQKKKLARKEHLETVDLQSDIEHLTRKHFERPKPQKSLAVLIVTR